MGPSNSAVIGCYNNSKKLNKWLLTRCEIHGVPHKNCCCKQPYDLWAFPSMPGSNL